MGITSYVSNFPSALYTGNTQAERISDDADVISNARDYNIHDEEIIALQESIGVYPEGTLPTGTVHRRLKDLEDGVTGAGTVRIHDIDGVSHTGTLSLDKVEVNITNVLGAAINNWMVKMLGTGDLDGDGIVSIQDALAALAINKEALDDLTLMRFEYPWHVPTGGGPGKPGGGGGGGGGIPVPGGGGGFDPSDPLLPVDDIWTGLEADLAGNYDQPIGLLVNFDTGDQYGVYRYRALGGTVLTGVRSTSDIGYADIWGTADVGTNYGLFYLSRPQTTGITSDGTVLITAAGGIAFESKQAEVSDSNNIIGVNLGDHVFPLQISPDVTGQISRCVYDGGGAPACGWCHVIDVATGDGAIDARLVMPDTGEVTIGVILSTPGAVGGIAWNTRLYHKLDASATTTTNVSPVATGNDVHDRVDLLTGVSVTKNQILYARFMGLNTSPFPGVMVVSDFFVEYTALS